MTELLVYLSMRFPGYIDQHTLSELLAPVVRAAVAAGGLTTNLSVQPFDASPDAEPTSHGSAIHTGEGASPTSPLSVAPHGSAAPCGGDR